MPLLLQLEEQIRLIKGSWKGVYSSAQSTSDMFKTWAQFSNYWIFFKSVPEVAEKSHKESMKIGESALWLDNGEFKVNQANQYGYWKKLSPLIAQKEYIKKILQLNESI